MLSRIREAADFQRLLALPPRRRSAHFAVHFVRARPLMPANRRSEPVGEELSTESTKNRKQVVDDSGTPAAAHGQNADQAPQAGEHWLGCVVPKRHARRAVTRNLVKRQMRVALARHQARLEPGLWLIRLKSPFPSERYPSAASQALRGAVREELEALLIQCEHALARASVLQRGA